MTNSMNNLKKGQKLTCGYRRASWSCTFLGFTDNTTAHSDVAVFDDWKALKTAKGFKSFKDLDADKDGRPYGYDHRAVFMDDDGMVWSSYRYGGFWAVGSSADRLRLND